MEQLDRGDDRLDLADSGASLTVELTDNLKVQRREIRMRRHQTLAAGAFKIDLQ